MHPPLSTVEVRFFRRGVRIVFSMIHIEDSLEKIISLEEALVVWEVSKVLEISFLGGKKMVMNKVCEIEESVSLATGSIGGLLCMWDRDWFIAEDLVVKEIFIAITGRLKSNGWQCGLINVYGPLVDSKKRKFFEKLSFLNMYTIPWFIGGDFNSFHNVEEKSAFPDVLQHLLDRSISDHNVVLLSNRVCN
ncbi:hypothetical protein V6N11_082828 [Hibiscus sabdariffa]|uniref:Endonuclease/exonuclease/phosphatase domain-containing protein n=1 Tax=Hibiscus sabdariffa TaxID=183260 RepID=A0ABR2QK27_9ROSI